MKEKAKPTKESSDSYSLPRPRLNKEAQNAAYCDTHHNTPNLHAQQVIKRRRMDLLLGLSYSFGLLLIGVAASAYWAGSSHLTGALWFTVSGVIWSVLTAGMQAQMAISRSEKINSGPQQTLERPVLIVDFSPVDFSGTPNATIDINKPRPGVSIIYGSLQATSVETADFNFVGKIKNIGRLAAIKADGSFWVYLGENLPTHPIYSPMDTHGWDFQHKLPPGPFEMGKIVDQTVNNDADYIPISVALLIAQRQSGTPQIPPERDIRGDIWSNRITFFFYGLVRYGDQFSHVREYGFGRRYIPNARRLDEAGGDAYNFDREVKATQPATPPR